MKAKFISLIFCICTLSASVAAQNVKHGFKAGLDVLSTTGSLTDLKKQVKGNYQLGGFLRIGTNLHFQPEIYFSQYRINGGSSINYLKIPAMTGLEIADFDVVKLRVQAGGTYIKQFIREDGGNFSWQAGIGSDVLNFITADIRYTINTNASISKQWNRFIVNGGILNLTIGIIL